MKAGDHAAAADGQANYGETGGYIGWFIAMPQGHIEATITKDGKTVTKTGSCYHIQIAD